MGEIQKQIDDTINQINQLKNKPYLTTDEQLELKQLEEELKQLYSQYAEQFNQTNSYVVDTSTTYDEQKFEIENYLNELVYIHSDEVSRFIQVTQETVDKFVLPTMETTVGQFNQTINDLETGFNVISCNHKCVRSSRRLAERWLNKTLTAYTTLYDYYYETILVSINKSLQQRFNKDLSDATIREVFEQNYLKTNYTEIVNESYDSKMRYIIQTAYQKDAFSKTTPMTEEEMAAFLNVVETYYVK